MQRNAVASPFCSYLQTKSANCLYDNTQTAAVHFSDLRAQVIQWCLISGQINNQLLPQFKLFEGIMFYTYGSGSKNLYCYTHNSEQNNHP